MAKLEAISKALRGESCEQMVLNTYAIIIYKPNCEPLSFYSKIIILYSKEEQFGSIIGIESINVPFSQLYTHYIGPNANTINMLISSLLVLELCILSSPKRNNLGSCKLCSIASLLYRFHAKAKYAWELGSTNPSLVMLGKIMGTAHICHLMPNFVFGDS